MEAMISKEVVLQQPNQFLCFEDKFHINFDLICDELARRFNCTYVSYALETHDGKRIHYYSNRKWQEVFIKERFIESCPLLKFAREANVSMLEWNSLSGLLTNQEKCIMEARKDFNIGNGIGAKHRIYGMYEMSTFASTVDNREFVRTFLKNIQCFKKYVFELRTLAITSMLISGWLQLSTANFNLNKFLSMETTNPASIH
ncbi:MAG TPA: autoinducer binding domain-containing protein [Gammaproteobacteria bacterium]|nr:autoinducer binding domain-containing protein [Gammaproteobacteria bacterium]